VFYISGHVSYVFIVLRVLKYCIYIRSPSGLKILEEPYKKWSLMTLHLPTLPTGGGAGGGGNFLEDCLEDCLEHCPRDLPGCEDNLRGWCFCRDLLVFV